MIVSSPCNQTVLLKKTYNSVLYDQEKPENEAITLKEKKKLLYGSIVHYGDVRSISMSFEVSEATFAVNGKSISMVGGAKYM